tara:strand:+ start:19 stop:168 length:150 start_codon:yes stop_codon:yes gene_type:complete
MRTQKHDLKYEIFNLEFDLMHSRLDRDAVKEQEITERLDVLKSTLINIQ